MPDLRTLIEVRLSMRSLPALVFKAEDGNEAELEKRAEADNLVGIYAALANKTKAEVLGEYGGQQFSTFKKALVELSVSRIGPVNAEMTRLLGDPAEIDRVLAEGARRARSIAAPIIDKVKDIVGFLRS